MKRFSIRDLERLSQIKAHTIRIWEQRYKMFTPQRSAGNVRWYFLSDLQRLLNIALLVKANCRASTLANCSPLDLEQRLQALVKEEQSQDKAINHLICYMYSDIEKFEDVLDSCVLCWGIDSTIERIIIPFLEKIDLLSYKDKSYETHFVVTAIRKKLILGIEKEKNSVRSQQSALLFLPEGEHYDLFLLYMTYLLKRKGVRTLYLGTNISVKNLQRLLEQKKPDILFTHIPGNRKFSLEDLGLYLHNHYTHLFLHAVCEPSLTKENANNIKFSCCKTFQEYIDTLSLD